MQYFQKLTLEPRIGPLLLCVLALALGCAFWARGQESTLPFLLGEWHYTGEGQESYTIDVRRNGDVWRTNGPMARVANTTERGGNFAFETKDFRCVYSITFLKDQFRSSWQSLGPKNRNCPSGIFERVLNETSDETQWWFVEGASDPSIIERFVKQFPRSELIDLARARIKELRRQQAAIASGVWAYVQGSNDPDELQKFAAQYPASPEAKQALARLDALKLRAQLETRLAEEKSLAGPVDNTLGCPLPPLSSRPAQPLATAEECAAPNSLFKECDKCPEMVVVPSGAFKMGSPETEQERADDEGPQHVVSLVRQFAVGRFAVTFDEWDACVADSGCNGYRPADQGWGRGTQPVINVSWNDAKAYVEWLAKRTGKPYRLLTEAEREYVTRAGTTTPFWWGSSITPSQANYNGTDSYAGGPTGDYRAKTLPVNWFDPNPFGLYQVHGNVLEWVEDCVHDSYKGAPADGSAWKSAGCNNRMMRGGAFSSDAASVRSAARYPTRPDARSPQRGFRIARTL